MVHSSRTTGCSKRIWSPEADDSGAVHCFGNGNFLIYGKGPNLWSIQGPPYTMPSFCGLELAEDNGKEIHCESCREPGSNVWIHRITGKRTAEFTDYMLTDKNIFIRDFIADEDVFLQLTEGGMPPKNNIRPVKYIYRNFDFGGRPMDCIMLQLYGGIGYLTNVAVERETWLILTVEGGQISEQGGILLHGAGRLIMAAGLLPDAIGLMTEALSLKPEDAIDAVRTDWKKFLSGIHDLGAKLPAGQVPDELRQRVSDACESVSILIKCQQSESGGVQAGHFYPMAFVRDMAGTMRGMLSLGMKEEARKVLTFWYSRFSLFGNVHNAEAMGNKSGRSIFPNDEVEVPAYLIISAFWYAEKTGDTEILNEIYPMLLWAFEIQLPQLGGGMTSFSGDETYIAGYVLPRIHTYDGSAESTLLFIEGGMRFLRWCRANHRLPDEKLAEYEKIVEDARNRYKDNFCIDGLLYANNPARLNYTRKPPYNFGFCEVHFCLEHKTILGWNIYNEKSDYYCCPVCHGKDHPNPFDRQKRHLLSSASLLPAFYESTIFDRAEMEKVLSPYINLFEENGFVPSSAEGSRSLGYDYGLFMYAASQHSPPHRLPALKAALDVLDETGAWVEYYDNGKPFKCRCRAWESGINIDAIRKLTECLT